MNVSSFSAVVIQPLNSFSGLILFNFFWQCLFSGWKGKLNIMKFSSLNAAFIQFLNNISGLNFVQIVLTAFVQRLVRKADYYERQLFECSDYNILEQLSCSNFFEFFLTAFVQRLTRKVEHNEVSALWMQRLYNPWTAFLVKISFCFFDSVLFSGWWKMQNIMKFSCLNVAVV